MLRNRDPRRTKRPTRLLAVLCLAAAFLSGCIEPDINFTDEVVHEQQKEARPACITANYLVGPGDELEILYHIDPGFMVEEYRIDTEDLLRIDFFYYPAMNRTVRVRPDGYITLPLVGEIMAAKKRPQDLAAELTGMYEKDLTRPAITVEVEEFFAKVEELKEAITTFDRGQSRLVVVRPDGGISLPYIGDHHAAGMTAQALSESLEQAYREYLESLSVTVAVLAAHSNRVYIAGQVGEPDYYELIGPTTLSQLVAQAGGLTPEADVHNVVLISRGENGEPMGKIIDLEDIIGEGNLGADIWLKQYDVVFVPRTGLAKAANFMDQVYRVIPLSFSINGAYGLGGVEPADND